MDIILCRGNSFQFSLKQKLLYIHIVNKTLGSLKLGQKYLLSNGSKYYLLLNLEWNLDLLYNFRVYLLVSSLSFN